MPPLSQLETDIAKYAEEGVKKFVGGVDTLAKTTAERINGLSSPTYGVAVKSVAERLSTTTWKVKTQIAPVKNAPGSILGGIRGIEAEVRRQMSVSIKNAKELM